MNYRIDVETTHYPFDVQCCYMGTSINHLVPDRVKLLFVTLTLSPECKSTRMSKITK